MLIGQTTYEEVVYLKNGSIIHGVIIEQIPNQSVKIQTKDKNVYVFKIEEIEKITKEERQGEKRGGNPGTKSGYNSMGLFIGAKAGIDFSTVSNADLGSSTTGMTITNPSKIGFQGGFIGIYVVHKYLAVQMELLFAQKGFEIKGTQSGVTVKSWITINYLSIPLSLRVSYPLGPVTIHGNLGPYLGFGLSAKFATDPDVGFNQKIEFQKDGGLKSFDFGLLFGAGVGYCLLGGELFLDLRYDLGLTDVNYLKTKPSDYKMNCNRNFGIAVGYVIKIGK